MALPEAWQVLWDRSLRVNPPNNHNGEVRAILWCSSHVCLPPQGKEKFLAILNKYMEIHGTVYYETQRPPEVPAFVKNHGLLPQHEFQQLLRKAKVGEGTPGPHPPLPVLLPGLQMLPAGIINLSAGIIRQEPAEHILDQDVSDGFLLADCPQAEHKVSSLTDC